LRRHRLRPPARSVELTFRRPRNASERRARPSAALGRAQLSSGLPAELHVTVINGNGDLSPAPIGDIIALHALSVGIAGFGIDGAVRDAQGLAQLGHGLC